MNTLFGMLPVARERRLGLADRRQLAYSGA